MIDAVAWDLETCLIEAGLLAPPMVCLTTCDSSLEPDIFHWADSFEVLRDILQNKNMVGQNIPFDLGVAACTFPELLPLVFEALFADRVVDTRLNERLIDIARGQLDGWIDHRGVFHRRTYSLSALSARYGFGEMEKDEWRLRYSELREVPLEQWPEGAKKYAKTDALRTLQVFYQQLAFEEFLVDAPKQAQYAFALHLQSCRGLITDARACDEFLEATKKEIGWSKALCQAHGIVDAAGKRRMKVARDRMTQVCHAAGLPVPMTKKGKDAKDDWEPSVCLDAEACRDTGDDVLKAYATYTSANTMLKKAELLKQGSAGLPLQTSYETLLETGRTSSRAPSPPLVGQNFQNMPQTPGLRECFIPRPGYVFCSIDFDMAELRTVSQICLWVLGHSKLAEALNSDTDVHSVLGADLMGCSYDEMVANKKHGAYKKNRNHGKMGNFSLWGGSGVTSFVAAVNKSAKKPEDRIDLSTGQRIKTAWQRSWTEQHGYFEWIKRMLGESQATYKSFISGRVRASLDYTTAANNGFQGLAADAGKSGLLPLAQECYCDTSSPLYGSRPVLYIHDEVLFELKIENAHEAAFRARDIMVENFNRYTPDVPVTATPTLMSVWSKSAETLYDKDGRLVVWSPAPKEVAA